MKEDRYENASISSLKITVKNVLAVNIYEKKNIASFNL